MNKIHGNSKYHNFLTKQFLKKYYYSEGSRGIAKRIGCSCSIVIHYLNKYKLKKVKISTKGREIKSNIMRTNRLNGIINSKWIKGKSRWLMHPKAVLQMKNKLKGRRLNKLGEFKKGHNKSLKKRGHLINKHHIDLNHNNDIPTNRLYLIDGMHQKIHHSAYRYLVKIGLIKKYIRWFIKQYNPKIYTSKDYIKQIKGD
jgi:hypothetical protein